MNYEFTNSPIISQRIDRRTNKQKKWAEEKKLRSQELKKQIYPVKELVSIGFYDQKQKKMDPYGIEVWSQKLTVRHKTTNYEWEERNIPRLSVSLPSQDKSFVASQIFPVYWEHADTYCCSFGQIPSVSMWCIFDLLSRVIYFPHWDYLESIPIRWTLGNQKTLDIAKKYIHQINISGAFSVPLPKPVWQGGLNATRHQATPYDYFWQTGKMPRDQARQYFDEIILKGS